MLIQSKKGKFDIAIYAIPSVILLVLVLLLFGTFFFTEFSKPSDLAIENTALNAEISLINFLRTEITLNNKNMNIYELIQPAYENQNSEEANELKNNFLLLKNSKNECLFLKITSLKDKDYIALTGDNYQGLSKYRNFEVCNDPKNPSNLEQSSIFIPNKDPQEQGFIISIGE